MQFLQPLLSLLPQSPQDAQPLRRRLPLLILIGVRIASVDEANQISIPLLSWETSLSLLQTMPIDF